MFAFGLLFALLALLIAFIDEHRDLPVWMMWIARGLVYLGSVLMCVSVFIALWWVMP